LCSVAPPPVEWKSVFAMAVPLRRTTPAVVLMAAFVAARSASAPR
jgi:hypothetical protein